MFMFPKGAVRAAVLVTSLVAVAAATASAASVTISSPSSGQTVASPFKVAASASSSYAVTMMQIYLDGNGVYTVKAASLSTSVSAGTGSHRLTVQAYDSSGYIFKNTIYVNVGTTSSTSTTSKVYSSIQKMSGWQDCSSCAGAGGTGPSAPHSVTQFVSSPSLSGASAHFFLGGSTPYSNALWWKQLGANSAVSHFVYDLWFYLKNPSVSQALEFDVNQTISGKQYIFGTECSYKGSHTWEVWDYYKHWVSTGIACTIPTAYQWHHLTWEFQRISGQMHFVALTLDGAKHYVNQYHTPMPKTTDELNVAFQMDGNSTMTDYDVWVDSMTLTAW